MKIQILVVSGSLKRGVQREDVTLPTRTALKVVSPALMLEDSILMTWNDGQEQEFRNNSNQSPPTPQFESAEWY